MSRKKLAWANKEVETFVCILGEEDVVYDVYVAAAAIDIRPTTKAAEKLAENDDNDWDSDMASVLLLLHLLPPSAGRKRRTKISPRDAADKMVHFHK
ncbi:unnamed protein product [Boreogadus saida]